MTKISFKWWCLSLLLLLAVSLPLSALADTPEQDAVQTTPTAAGNLQEQDQDQVEDTEEQAQPQVEPETKVPPSLAASRVAQVKVRSVRMRTGPGLDYQVITLVNEGDKFAVLSEEAGWLQLAKLSETETALGWVFADLMLVEEAEASESDEDADSADSVDEAEVETKEKVADKSDDKAEPAPILDLPETDAEEPSADATAETDLATKAETTGTDQKQEVAEQVAATATSATKSSEEPEAPAETKKEPSAALLDETSWSLDDSDREGFRRYFLQVTPGVAFVTRDRDGEIDSDAFSIVVRFGGETIYDIYLDGFYAYTGYRPGEGTHEAGGGLRYQRSFWRLGVFAGGNLGYSGFMGDDNLVVKATGGLFFNVGGRPYNLLLGPAVDYSRIFRNDDAGDLENVTIGLSIIFLDTIAQ